MHEHSVHFYSQDNKMVPQNVTYDNMKSKNINEDDHLHRMAMLENCFKHKNKKGDSVPGSTLASSVGNFPLSRETMAAEGSLQTRCRPVPHSDSGDHTRPQIKKATVGCSTGQMPQSLLNELSSVLHQTGRTPREES